jgi:hypothetical protein
MEEFEKQFDYVNEDVSVGSIMELLKKFIGLLKTEPEKVKEFFSDYEEDKKMDDEMRMKKDEEMK